MKASTCCRGVFNHPAKSQREVCLLLTYGERTTEIVVEKDEEVVAEEKVEEERGEKDEDREKKIKKK